MLPSALSYNFVADNHSMNKKRIIVHNALGYLYQERNNTNMSLKMCFVSIFCSNSLSSGFLFMINCIERNDECHAKIDLFEVKKIGNFMVFKIV